MNVKYFSLYKEVDGDDKTFIIPIRESKKEYATQGFVFTYGWIYNPSLVSPEEWEESEYLTILDMSKTPKKNKLIKLVFNSKL